MGRLIEPGGQPTSRATKIIVICACIGIVGIGLFVQKHNKNVETQRLTRETENKRVIDNAKRAIGHDAMKFVHAFGGSEGVEIHATYDGKYTVSIPSVTVTKEQLEKYAADNTTWIEE